MHYEILVEDQSGKIALEHLLPLMIPEGSTFKIHPYRGIGQLPRNLHRKPDPSKRALMNNLPRLLRGYGNAFAAYPADYSACLIIVCDLDNRIFSDFLGELLGILEKCNPQPNARFCLCIEEGEAWLLGHKEAVRTAYPSAKVAILESYSYDSICGTWECLANVVYPGGAEELKKKGKPEVGRNKAIWAREIAPLIDIDENKSPSFQYFVQTVREAYD
jgi:hypothetical protein